MYRTIDAAFWTDPKVRKLNPHGRFLLLYLITNPHTHVSGIYYLPSLIMQHETGLSVRVLDTLSANLDTLSLARFDTPNELVWVVNMFKFQGSGQKNTLSAAHHLNEDIHNSYLINAFCERYPQVKEFVKNRVSEFGTPDPRSLIPDPEQEQEQRGRGTAAKSLPPATIPVTAEMKAFAVKCGVRDAEAETEAMLDHFRGTGVQKLDWQATWRNWMRRHTKFNGAEGNGNGKRNKTKAEITHEAGQQFLRELDGKDR